MYVEVKATASSDKEHFEISTSELLHSHKFKEQYVILRVYNVNSPPMSIDLIVHPWELLEKKGAQLYMRL